MTISTAATPLSYAGDDSTTAFAVTWAYIAKGHVVATLRGTDGTETVWVLDTDYTLTAAGASGTLTATTPPATGETLVITSEPPNTQTSDIPRGGAFPAVTVENALDLAAQRDAKIEALYDRSLRVPKTDTRSAAQLELPNETDRASKFLAFDANGDPTAVVGSADTVTVTPFMATVLDDATQAAARITLGVGTTDSPTFTGLTLTGAFTSLGIDDNATAERVQIGDSQIQLGAASVSYILSQAAADQTFTLSGGNASTNGANIILYGGSHANANDIVIRGGTTNQVYYDDSASEWDFQENDITTTGSVNAGGMTLTSTDAGAGLGPTLKLKRDSASPADSDLLGSLEWESESDTSTASTWARIFLSAVDVTDGTEDSWMYFQNMSNGTLTTEMIIKSNTGDIDFQNNDLITTGNIELGHASDTTLSRAAAGQVAVEGNNLARIKTGTYTGDGSTSLAVTGVGFQPSYVRIWARTTTDGGAIGIFETTDTIMDDNGAGGAIQYNSSSNTFEANKIISLDSDGFTVDDDGADASPNTNGAVYNYLAMG